MAYQGKLSGSQVIVLENDGDQTTIRLSSEGQRQSSSASTGEWQGTPVLWQLDDSAVVEIKTGDDSVFYRVKGGQLQSLSQKPDLATAEAVDLEEVQDGTGKSEMKPLEPMKPMKPM
ncbi:hypothetical protein GCM10022631_00520 [Deinococcus rubellus]|uniref:Uncharacterized protein n=1 Tax=Deinococcus rubellus TaxID=1889240 RepID=A0ABY5YF21_9DEIO|nr:hypothetical protein [Deinococcus rubellus]UWX62992.1 hypothetical protein N0D28_09470 [Deinococcus rubellus]